MSAEATSNTPAGILPGAWPNCPDAPLVVPVRGRLHLPKKMRKAMGEVKDLPLGFVLELDRIRVCPLRDGTPVHMPTLREESIPPFMPLAGFRIAEPGELDLGGKDFSFTAVDLGGMRAEVTCSSGPAVWLRSIRDAFVPTAEPQKLAFEIERRRAYVAKFGGMAANEVWRRAPELRVEGPDGFQPGRGTGTPDAPVTVEGWKPMAAFPATAPSAGQRAPQPWETPDDLPFPEQLRGYEVRVHSSGDSVRLSVTGRRLLLSQEPVLAKHAVIEDHPVPSNAISVPLAELQVIQAGTISGSSSRSVQQWYAPDAKTLIDLGGGDGPAVWLWGPTTEWVLRTPDAQRIAEDIRMRQQVSVRYPVSSDLGPERRTWWDYPLTKPTVESNRNVVSPPPDYAPATPTVVPPGCWQPI